MTQLTACDFTLWLEEDRKLIHLISSEDILRGCVDLEESACRVGHVLSLGTCGFDVVMIPLD